MKTNITSLMQFLVIITSILVLSVVSASAQTVRLWSRGSLTPRGQTAALAGQPMVANHSFRESGCGYSRSFSVQRHEFTDKVFVYDQKGGVSAVTTTTTCVTTNQSSATWNHIDQRPTLVKYPTDGPKPSRVVGDPFLGTMVLVAKAGGKVPANVTIPSSVFRASSIP